MSGFFFYHDRYRDVKWAHISGDIGRYRTICGDIVRYRAILSDIRVIFSSVKSVFCWVRSKSSRTGSVNYRPNMVRPCRIRTVTKSPKSADTVASRYISHSSDVHLNVMDFRQMFDAEKVSMCLNAFL